MGKGGRQKRKGEKTGIGRGQEGPSPPFANSLFRPWLPKDRPPDSQPGLCPRTPLGTSVCQIHSLRSLLHNSWSTSCEPLTFWNTGYADGETHPNYHPLKALGCGNSRHSGVIWRHPMSYIFCHVICTKYCYDFLIRVASMSSNLLST